MKLEVLTQLIGERFLMMLHVWLSRNDSAPLNQP